MASLSKNSILGVHISPVNPRQTVNFIWKAIAQKKKITVNVAAVHLLMECQSDRQLLAGINNADLTVPDGMPLVWILNALGNSGVRRVYGPDLMLTLCQRAAKKKHTIFFIGGELGQSVQLTHKLKSRFSHLRVVGAHDTPIRPIPQKQNLQIIRRLNAVKPDIVVIGMGCPYQEKWIIAHRNDLRAPVLIGVGAAFDFLTGKTKQAPKWVQYMGFEWLFRLTQEPKRLWKRYLYLNAKFLWLLVFHWLLEVFQKLRSDHWQPKIKVFE